MNLKGEKVLLRALEKEDMEFLREMINDQEMEKCVVGWSFPVSKYEQEKWFENQVFDKYNLRLLVENEGEKIGLTTITNIDWKNRKASLGIKLYGENVRCKGLGTDTILTSMKYAFEELQLNRLYANILEYNEASIRLYKKCGWTVEGTARKSVFKNNKYHDELQVGILKEDYIKLFYSGE